jgi:class 3 adenylate cyclase
MPGQLARTETVTVLFTELVGSTELANRLGHDAYEALRQEHFTACRAAVATHLGAEIKTIGDGLMLCFVGTADAVACSAALLRWAWCLCRRGFNRQAACRST